MARARDACGCLAMPGDAALSNCATLPINLRARRDLISLSGETFFFVYSLHAPRLSSSRPPNLISGPTRTAAACVVSCKASTLA